jgi:hypothetical protein
MLVVSIILEAAVAVIAALVAWATGRGAVAVGVMLATTAALFAVWGLGIRC